MRQYPADEDDMQEMAMLEAPTWMVEQLKRSMLVDKVPNAHSGVR
jgi:hypothetical protein